MSVVPWADRTPEERDRLARAFAGLHGADTMLDPGFGPAVPAAMSALFRAATDPATPLPAGLVGRMAADPALRADFDRLLARVARYRMPRAAAAGTGALDRRAGDGVTLRLRPSSARPDQVHVLIDLPDTGPEDSPTVLIVRDGSGRVWKHGLGEPVEGIVRLLLAADDPCVTALGDPATEIDLI